MKYCLRVGVMVLLAVVDSTLGFSVRMAPFEPTSGRRVDAGRSQQPRFPGTTRIRRQLFSTIKNEEENDNDRFIHPKITFPKWAAKAVLGTTLFLGSTFASVLPPSSLGLGVSPAYAEGSKVVGALKGSGLVFKDTLQIERFEGTCQEYGWMDGWMDTIRRHDDMVLGVGVHPTHHSFFLPLSILNASIMIMVVYRSQSQRCCLVHFQL